MDQKKEFKQCNWNFRYTKWKWPGQKLLLERSSAGFSCGTYIGVNICPFEVFLSCFKDIPNVAGYVSTALHCSASFLQLYKPS
ncbi:hypothetical protein ACH5RR_000589 [Cinchona calisaya]|uniref:Uncharacterized protein n=1 Tax=Cinchona calisaya TaxID=153742 RepID=A0ABD3B1M0_9GENT